MVGSRLLPAEQPGDHRWRATGDGDDGGPRRPRADDVAKAVARG